MNEYEIRRALAGAAPDPAGPDPDRLRSALVRADRMRTVRTAIATAAVAMIACAGVVVSQTGESSGPIDVVDQPDPPAPDPVPPAIDDADTATSTTTSIPPTPSEPAGPAVEPDHLAAPTTTAPPALITATTTTVPPTTTTAPPPTTTAVPTTTAPPASTAPPTTTTESAPVEFTAAARYGSCEEDPPYDEYSGTAAPGATITVTSAHNATAQTTTDTNGDWYLRVEFPDAPVGETFDVTVTDGATAEVFDFVRTA